MAAAAIAANATPATMLKTQKIILNPILFFHLLLTIYSLKGKDGHKAVPVLAFAELQKSFLAFQYLFVDFRVVRPA